MMITIYNMNNNYFELDAARTRNEGPVRLAPCRGRP